MKILFDHQIFSMVNYGGISRYFYELMKGLVEAGHDVKNTAIFSENIFTKDQNIFNSIPILPNVEFPGKVRFKKSINLLYTNYELRKNNFDIYHPTYYETRSLSKFPRTTKLVCTFHDLIHEKLVAGNHAIGGVSDMISNRIKLLEACSIIIAVSESTKKDIVEYYNIDPLKIKVIHLSSSIKTDKLYKDSTLGEYILFVGNRMSYKNFNTFVIAAAHLLKKNKNVRIICVGGGNFARSELRLIHKLQISSQVIYEPFDELKLAQLYHNALFFVFPSLYEGFGIPILESFSCGCPAILSNRSSMPEVGGEAALYIDPENQDDISNKMDYLFENESKRMNMKKLGIEWRFRRK